MRGWGNRVSTCWKNRPTNKLPWAFCLSRYLPRVHGKLGSWAIRVRHLVRLRPATETSNSGPTSIPPALNVAAVLSRRRIVCNRLYGHHRLFLDGEVSNRRV